MLLAALITVSSAFALTGCGGGSKEVTYKDGTYEGKSSVYINEDEDSDEGNGYGVVTITIKDGKITDCVYKTYEEDGTLKDEEYGKEDGEIANRDFYNKAQKALKACDEYAAQLLEAEGDIDSVDAISGATINYDHFKEGLKEALQQAAE